MIILIDWSIKNRQALHQIVSFYLTGLTFYYKQAQEVDFVITELGKPVDAIQVCYSDFENQATRDREINALLECLQDLKLSSGKILTLSLEDVLLREGKTIHLIPLYQWLSDPRGFES